MDYKRVYTVIDVSRVWPFRASHEEVGLRSETPFQIGICHEWKLC
jgi:hypothetical protein